jgi:hypothetical protein
MLTYADVVRSSAGALLPFVSVRDDYVFCEVLGEASCRYSIRQHTSAYVSIRHTHTIVSVRDDYVFCEVLGEASCRYSIYLLYYLYFCTSTASRLSTCRWPPSAAGVSICTFVPVQQVD